MTPFVSFYICIVNPKLFKTFVTKRDPKVTKRNSIYYFANFLLFKLNLTQLISKFDPKIAMMELDFLRTARLILNHT